MTSRRKVAYLLALTIVLFVIVLATAPFWAARAGFSLPQPPPPGRLVVIAGHRLNVFDEGAGPAVVLVHGLPGSAHDWRPLPERLVAAGFRVIRYDRVGYGRSTPRPRGEPAGIESNGRELLELIAALDLPSPILVGWSYGGVVAQSAAVQASSGIRGLVLVGSDGPASPGFGWFATVFEATEPIRRWGVASGFPVRLGVRRMARQAFGESVPDWWPGHAASVVAAREAVRTWTREVSDFDPASIPSSRISVPVTIVHGSDDTFVPPAVAEALHRQIQRSTLVRLNGAGHMLPNTHADVIVRELAAVLRPAPHGSR